MGQLAVNRKTFPKLFYVHLVCFLYSTVLNFYCKLKSMFPILGRNLPDLQQVLVFKSWRGDAVCFCLCHNWYANDSVSSLCWYVPCIRHFRHWTSLHADVNLIWPWSMISCLQNELDLFILYCGVCVKLMAAVCL